jgi:ATP-dependent Clp protease ATP-binding subunit ClpC
MARDPMPEQRLPFDVSVLVRAHANGTVTARVVGESDLVAWGPELAAVQEDLELALTDRIERAHPSRLAGFQALRGRELIQVEVEGVLEVLGDPVMLRPTSIAALVEPEASWRRVWLPQLDARLWVRDDDDLAGAVRELVGRLVRDRDTARRWALRAERGAELVPLQVTADLAPLVRFTGRHLGDRELQAPDPQEEVEQEEARTQVPTPTLDRIAIDLHSERSKTPAAHGRDADVAELLRMLERPGAAVVVIGPTASGKTAVVDEVVRQTPRKAWFVDASRLVVAPGSTDWREQTAGVAREVAAAEGIWLIGDPIDLLDAGKHVGSEMNAAQILKGVLPTAGARLLAECSEVTWGRLEARDASFARLFTPWRLTAPEPVAVRSILDAVARELPVTVAPDGVDTALGLCARYGPADALLGTTCQFLRRLAAEALARGSVGPLGRLDAIRRFCAESGMPELLVRDELTLDPAAVEASFRERLVGQDPAVAHLVDLIAVIKGGMSDLARPLGSFLFVGPTGVGKTEASKALAAWLFGDPGRLVRFDMSEFAGPDCLIRLLDRDSGLVARVRRTPFCVVLLDEIEKAHPAVFDLLLQVLGEARLSDPDGRTADFRNAVVLMTSNLGVGSFRRPSGFGADLGSALRDHVLAEVQRFFRPELFNRIDRVVPFASLDASAIAGIAAREVHAVAAREGLRGRGITLELGPDVVPWLAARGVDARLGARPLKRAVTDHLVAPLARHLAGSGTPPRVRVGVHDHGLTFGNADGDGRTAVHERLRTLWERLGVLRHRAELWQRCETARTGAWEVRLVDRLMAGKRFWAGGGAARARAEAVAPLRDALDALTAAHTQILALEELALEAWSARDGSSSDALTAQADEVEHQLENAELGLAGTAFPRPDRADLIITPDDHSEEFGRRLAAAYLAIAEARGWQVAVQAGGPAWLRGDVEGLVKKVRASTWAGLIRLQVTGAHAAPLLFGEVGFHALRDTREARARVSFGTGPEITSDRSLRVVDVPRSQLRDVPGKVTTTLHARLERSMIELMRLAVLGRLLGAETGQRLWRATDPWRTSR